ncbi:hypothetical protein ILUMI_01904 [Ignelater luminosus]|uniref:Uncharacterized protein n=1 Tax=Ignelater luminosus TaxID=2038154 RepID=A0A8K0GJS7_IGNLU|nr:hypothetical protein ILUMI_01904 [Ignelater luminosus]
MFKSTSTILSFVSFLLLQWLLLPTLLKAECIDSSSPRIRVFKSLVDLQTNNKSFYPHDPNFEGNYVALSKSNIDILPKNSFIARDSNHIEKLILDDHGIRIIQDGAFISLTCLSYLQLQKNQLTNISKGVFQDLIKLHELNLGENYIVEIPERVFTFLVLNNSKVSYKRSSASKPNVDGIACNISVVTQKTSRLNYDTPTVFITTTEIPEFYTKVQSAGENFGNLSIDVLNSIERTQTIVICLLVVVVIFIMADVAVRCGCLNFWLNRRRQTFFR